MSANPRRPVLSIEGLSKEFGGVRAVKDLSMVVEEGTITSLIGPNGAGKTTVFNLITGVYRASKGRVHFVPKSDESVRLHPPLDLAFWQVGLLTGAAAGAAALCAWIGKIWTGYAFWAGALGATGFFGVALIPLFLGARIFPRKSRGEAEELTHRRLDVLQAMMVQIAAVALAVLAKKTLEGIGAGPFWAFSAALAGGAAVLGLALTAGRETLYRQLSPDEINRLGVGRTFQNIRLFHDLSVLDNVKVGLHSLAPLFFEERKDVEASALKYLEFVGLLDRVHETAASLAYGDQRRLEIARALATHPKLLLLDEPAAGLNPAETQVLIELIRRIRDTGVTVLLIEHDMKLVMNISDRIWVLDHGELIASGATAEVQRNPKVIEAYLGVEEPAGA